MSNNINWQKGKLVSKRQTAVDMLSMVFELETFVPHQAGQFYQLKMPDMMLDRCYSVMSTPMQKTLEFGIQLIPNGVISPRLWELPIGGEVEMIGPLGEFFNWDSSMTEPLLLLGAGSGITPLLSIYRTVQETVPDLPVTFIMGAKSPDRIVDYDQLEEVLITRFSQEEGRIDREFLESYIPEEKRTEIRAYVCGPVAFIDDMVDYLLEMGLSPERIRSERFI